MKKNRKKFVKIVKDLWEKGYKSKEIMQIILDKYDIRIPDRTIRYWIKNIIKKDAENTKVKSLREDIDYKKPFIIEENNVIIYYKDGDITKKVSIPIEEIRSIWEDFVEKGGNLSQWEIINKYELNPRVWYLIKNRLGLYKKSDIIPDWLLEKVEKEKGEKEVEELIEEISHKVVFNKYNHMIVKKYQRKKEDEYKKSITKLYEIENFLEMIRDYIDNYNPPYKQIDFPKIKKTKNNQKIYVGLSDIHLGKEETDKIEERIENITEDLVSREENDITIFVLGDIVENLAIGGMHKGQIENMDGPFGFDLIMKTVSVFEKMLLRIRKAGKKVTMIGQVGNHGRISERDYMDYTGELIIYEMIKRGLQGIDGIEIEYLRDIWGAYSDENFHFILQHGHLNGVKKRTKDILWEFGDNKKFNIILQGHVHVGILEDASKNATRIIIPALAGSGHYDKALGLSSYPGYVILKENNHGLPDTTFIRLE